MICFVTSDFITSLSRIKNLRNTCECLYHIQVLGGISFLVMAGNWENLKDTLAISSFLVSNNRNRVLLTNDFHWLEVSRQ